MYKKIHVYTTLCSWDAIHWLNEKVRGGGSRRQIKAKTGSLLSLELCWLQPLLLHRGLQRSRAGLPSVSTAVASPKAELGNNPGRLSRVVQAAEESTEVETPSPVGPQIQTNAVSSKSARERHSHKATLEQASFWLSNQASEIQGTQYFQIF